MKEKIALVTGANKGIGFGIAKHLGLSGWKVIIGARNGQRAEKAINELKAQGIDVLGWVNIELKDLANIASVSRGRPAFTCISVRIFPACRSFVVLYMRR